MKIMTFYFTASMILVVKVIEFIVGLTTGLIFDDVIHKFEEGSFLRKNSLLDVRSSVGILYNYLPYCRCYFSVCIVVYFLKLFYIPPSLFFALFASSIMKPKIKKEDVLCSCLRRSYLFAV